MIDVEAGKVGGEEFGFLLGVSCGAVGLVAGLYLVLKGLSEGTGATSTTTGSQIHSGRLR